MRNVKGGNVRTSRKPVPICYIIPWVLAWTFTFAFPNHLVFDYRERVSPPVLLVLGPRSAKVEILVGSLYQAVGSTFQLQFRHVAFDTSYEAFKTHILMTNPDAILLLDNWAIDHYATYQEEYPNHPLPAIASMGLQVNEEIEGLENVAALPFEVPAFRAFAFLDELTVNPVKRVGVLYREPHTRFVLAQQENLVREGIELTAFPIHNEDHLNKTLRNGLDYLLFKKQVDALWVLNDAVLLNPERVQRVWIPKLKKFRKPVVVGVKELVLGEFGTFAMVPDNEALGRQLAEMVLALKKSAWHTPSKLVPPCCVVTVLNKRFARKYLLLKQEALAKVDVLVENGW